MVESHPVVSRQILDPEALTAAIRNANFQPCQLSVRPTPSRLTRVICPELCLDFVSLGATLLFTGSMPADCYTLVFVTDCPRKGRAFNFAVEHNGGYLGIFPPGGIIDAYTPEGYANATLTVPARVFEAAVERLIPEVSGRILKHGAGMRIGAGEQAHLRGLLKSIMEQIGDPSGPLGDRTARSNLEVDLLDAFLAVLRSGCNSLPGQRTVKRLKRLKQARDYLTDNIHQPLSMSVLCEEMGMSRRGVELLFQDSLGIGPNAFLRHQRLHGARRGLIATPPAAGVVKQIALGWGFWHMGHFAREYRELFGESPSATLARQACS